MTRAIYYALTIPSIIFVLYFSIDVIDLKQLFQRESEFESNACVTDRHTTAPSCRRAGSEPTSERFVTMAIKRPRPGRLGNQIWRLASLYGVGRTSKRQPYLNISQTLQMENVPYLIRIFPNLFCKVRILASLPAGAVETAFFGDRCCKYYDPLLLARSNATVARLRSYYLQSYKYFQNYRNEILGLFRFDQATVIKAQQKAKSLFRREPPEQPSHIVCVHTRRTDYVKKKFVMDESRPEFVQAAVSYVLSQRIGTRNYSVVLLGDDYEFIKTLPVKSEPYARIMRPRPLEPEVDMYFGSAYCDSIILSASGSTFGWWTAYFSKKATIFYNGQMTRLKEAMFILADDYDFFPPNWIKLIAENGTIRREDRWWSEWNDRRENRQSDRKSSVRN